MHYPEYIYCLPDGNLIRAVDANMTLEDMVDGLIAEGILRGEYLMVVKVRCSRKDFRDS